MYYGTTFGFIVESLLALFLASQFGFYLAQHPQPFGMILLGTAALCFWIAAFANYMQQKEPK